MQGQTGSYVTTTLLAPPLSAILTTLANVRDDLDIDDPSDTSNDTRLTRYIAEESAAIARYCNRVFGLATWQDVFRLSRGVWGEGVREANNPLMLVKWPLATTSTLTVTETILGVDTALVADTDFEVDLGSRLAGDEGVSRLYRLNALGNPRTWLADKVTVVYQAGYTLPNDQTVTGIQPLPSDLETACLRLVVARHRAHERDPMLMQRTQGQLAGMERFWVGPSPGQKGPYPTEISSTLDLYRTPVLA